MSTASPIGAAYLKLLSKGRLQHNSAQLALVKQLGRLQNELLTTPIKQRRRSMVQHGNGIYIYGGVGTGKSRIADLFAATLPNTVRCRRVHFHEFMVDVHSNLHLARSQDRYAGDPLIGIGQQIHSQSPVLCFDEFQVSDIADAMILKRLFGSFWNSGGIIVSTSNRHPSELYLHGLNRSLFLPFIKELEHRCLVWKMDGDRDYRMSTEYSRTPVFFTDESAFRQALLESTQGVILEPVRLRVVMNRSITVLATSSAPASDDPTATSNQSLVHTTFRELCEASVGTSDYHALCRFAHTIFLSGLRQFQANELDFVRRLITLIDIAYESRTRLICLSSTPLAELFKNVGIVTRPSIIRPTGEVSAASTSHPVDLLESSITVKGEGGSSSSMMSTFLNDVEWSATGLRDASLATGGAGENDVRFAIGRAISRLTEMETVEYGCAGT